MVKYWNTEPPMERGECHRFRRDSLILCRHNGQAQPVDGRGFDKHAATGIRIEVELNIVRCHRLYKDPMPDECRGKASKLSGHIFHRLCILRTHTYRPEPQRFWT